MHLFIQATCFIVALDVAAAVALEGQCATAINFNNKYYRKQTLLKGILGEPIDVSVQDKTGDIFFTRVNNEVEDVDKKLFILKSGSDKAEEIQGIKGLGQSSTVDNDKDVVYLSSDRGLYTYNGDTNTAALLAEEGVHINHIYYANKAIYIVTWPDYDFFKMTKNATEKTAIDPDFLYGYFLVVDSKEKNYFVGNTDYTYAVPKDLSEKVRQLRVSKKARTILAVDRKDNVFVTDDEKLYKITVDRKQCKDGVCPNTSKYIGDVDVVPTAIAFDKLNNVIVGHKGGITKYAKIDC